MNNLKTVKSVYSKYINSIPEARKFFGRPLTYTEKILFSHLNEPLESIPKRTKSFCSIKPDRVAMQDATAQMALLQFMNSGMKTTAVESNDHFILNGAKMWITNGTIADLAIVWAKLDGKIRGFIVEKDDVGFSAPEMKGKHSLRASITSELVFQDCKIPKNRILPNVTGLKGPLGCLTQARYGIAWGSLGAAMGCFISSKDYSLSRIQFD